MFVLPKERWKTCHLWCNIKMYKYITILLFLIPMQLFANRDGCLYPTEYTIDKRCYVTDSEKQTKPYNAVVYLVENGCTGTIVQDNNNLYLYTAKHCVDTDLDNKTDKKIDIKLQDDRIITATRITTGGYDIKSDENHYGDWAVYQINNTQDNIPYVHISDFFKNPDNLIYYYSTVIGYGLLKIMSDKEIANLKNMYISHLKNNKSVDYTQPETTNTNKIDEYGFFRQGIHFNNSQVSDFMFSLDADTYQNIFFDRYLKKSICVFNNTGSTKHCQTWTGNSGGGIFDSYGEIMGIYTRGIGLIGGKHHAGYFDNFFNNTGINIVNEFIPNQVTK